MTIYQSLVENWVNTIGMLVVINIGLFISIYGAIKIYRADKPRNDWILENALELADVPRYGVIAHNGYNRGAEKELNLKRVREIKEQMDKHDSINRLGMKYIFIGFIIQFAGNSLLGLSPFIMS